MFVSLVILSNTVCKLKTVTNTTKIVTLLLHSLWNQMQVTVLQNFSWG